MHAYTGHWSTSYYLEQARKRLAEERKLYAKNRAMHRSLDRKARLLTDLNDLSRKLRVLQKSRLTRTNMSSTVQRKMRRLLHRFNQLTSALESLQ